MKMSRRRRCRQFGPEVLASVNFTDTPLILVPSKVAARQWPLSRGFFSIVRRLDLSILRFSSRLCKLNQFNEEEDENDKLQTGSSSITSCNGIGAKLSRIFSLTVLASLFFTCSIVGLLKRTYYHYIYDYYVFQLNLIRHSKCSADGGLLLTNCWNETSPSGRLESYLTSKMEVKRRELARVGSPLISAPPFSAECWYITWIGYTLIIFSSMAVNVTGGRLRTNFTRLSKDPFEEQERLNGLALQEVNKYLASNFNFNGSHVVAAMENDDDEEEEEDESGGDGHQTEVKEDKPANGDDELSYCWIVGKRVFTRAGVSKLVKDYTQNMHILETILKNGDVIRFFSFSTDWLDSRALFHSFYFVAMNLFYISITIIMLARLVNENSRDHQQQLQTSIGKMNELVALIEIVILICSCIFLSVMFALIIVVDWFDELEVTRRLHELLLKCVHLNDELFNGRHEGETVGWIMNANLLFALISYKMYVMRAKHSLWIQRFAANVSLRLMFVFPVVVKLHSPYCSADALLSMVYLCLATSLATTLFMLNTCHINHKTMLLHKPLASLMAHLVELNNWCQLNGLPGIYSEHSVWCLQKELADQNRFHESKAPTRIQLSFNLTFGFLIKAEFWLHLLILSTFSQTQSDLSSSFLSDPLRLLDDHLTSV